MSNLPPTYPPPPPPTYPPGIGYADRPTPMPGSIKTLSIIAIVLGSLFLLCDCIGLASAGAMLAMGGKNPMAPSAPPMTQPGVQAFLAADSFIKLALAGTLLAGGIGGVRLARWARPAMLWWSIAALAWATISLAIQLVWTVPATVQYSMQAQAQMNPRMPPNMMGILKASQIVGAVIAWLCWCVLPACFLILWRSPQVVEAFEYLPEQSPPPQPPGAPRY